MNLACFLTAVCGYCRSGSQSLRQVYFATLDLALHSEYQPGKGGSVFKSDIVRKVIKENTVVPPLPEDRFLNSFQHIFAGGYSAGTDWIL